MNHAIWVASLLFFSGKKQKVSVCGTPGTNPGAANVEQSVAERRATRRTRLRRSGAVTTVWVSTGNTLGKHSVAALLC